MPQERTQKVAVAMVPASLKSIVAREQIDQLIEWPDYQTWKLDEFLAKDSPEKNLERAARLIDSQSDRQVSQAKAILEKLLQQNPNLDEGYVQLARIALYTNAGPEGFHQAEELLATALHIRPDSANAKILLAHVYAYENRFASAEALFSAAAASGTKNLWVWSNWGEMLEAEHKDDQAIVMYRKAVSHPMTHDTYDRARAFAYDRLLDLLQQRRDYDGMETLYKQRIAEFGPGSCYSADYTRFLLQVRGDAQGAIDLARRALNQSCDDTVSRELLGLAEYVKYAAATGPAAEQALNQAHIYLPPGPKVLYLLAQSDRTTPAARRLIATGEKIDEKDDEQLDALAYALEARDYAAVKRLVKLGARPDTPVSPRKFPVAFLPVVSEDITGVLTMRQLGVDYSRVRYRGATAFDIATRLGDSALLTALGGKGVGL